MVSLIDRAFLSTGEVKEENHPKRCRNIVIDNSDSNSGSNRISQTGRKQADALDLRPLLTSKAPKVTPVRRTIEDTTIKRANSLDRRLLS